MAAEPAGIGSSSWECGWDPCPCHPSGSSGGDSSPQLCPWEGEFQPGEEFPMDVGKFGVSVTQKCPKTNPRSPMGLHPLTPTGNEPHMGKHRKTLTKFHSQIYSASFPRQTATGREGMVSACSRGDSGWTSAGISSWKELSGFGTAREGGKGQKSPFISRILPQPGTFHTWINSARCKFP